MVKQRMVCWSNQATVDSIAVERMETSNVIGWTACVITTPRSEVGADGIRPRIWLILLNVMNGELEGSRLDQVGDFGVIVLPPGETFFW